MLIKVKDEEKLEMFMNIYIKINITFFSKRNKYIKYNSFSIASNQSHKLGFPGGASGKEPAYQCRRPKRHGFYPRVRKIPWRRGGKPLQNSFLENPMDTIGFQRFGDD